MAEPAVDRAYSLPAHRARKPAPSCDQGGRLRPCPPEFRIVAKKRFAPRPSPEPPAGRARPASPRCRRHSAGAGNGSPVAERLLLPEDGDRLLAVAREVIRHINPEVNR